MKAKLLRRFRRNIEIRQKGCMYKVTVWINNGWDGNKVETIHTTLRSALIHAHQYIRVNEFHYHNKKAIKARKRDDRSFKWKQIYP